jgi:hypothetical protein
MTAPYSDDLLAVEHPELAVLELLGHALRAAHDALAVVHPEIDARSGNLGPLEEQCHIAMLIGIDLRDLQQQVGHRSLQAGHATIENTEPPRNLEAQRALAAVKRLASYRAAVAAAIEAEDDADDEQIDLPF